MKTRTLLLAAALILTTAAYSQTTPEPASKLIDDACKLAAKQKKNVMVIFHASWCGWCKKFDASLNDPSCKEYFDRSFVFVHLTVMENGDKKKLENPGANELLLEKAGGPSGIPYFLIYDKKGVVLADSRFKAPNASADAKPSNMGCPAAPEEVAAFIEILKKTTKISEAEILAVTERFKKNKS